MTEQQQNIFYTVILEHPVDMILKFNMYLMGQSAEICTEGI